MTNMKTLTIWFIDEATMCCWLMKTTFKLIYGLPMKKETSICISVISITHCTDFLTFALLFLPFLFHLHIQYLLLHHPLFGENYIHITYNVFIAKSNCVAITITFTKQLYKKLNSLTYIFQGFCPQVQNSYFLEHLQVVEHQLWSKSLKYTWKSSLLTKLQTFILQL